MALQWATGGNGAQREPGRFSSPGGQRYPRGGVWRRLPLARHRPRLYFEALGESSLRPALKSYFHPQPKSATAHYTANNGERAARHREELRGGGAETDFSRGRAPGAPAPNPEGLRRDGRPSRRGRGAAGSEIPSDTVPRGGRSLVESAAERGRRGAPASRTGARGPRTAGGGQSRGRARLCVPRRTVETRGLRAAGRAPTAPFPAP